MQPYAKEHRVCVCVCTGALACPVHTDTHKITVLRGDDCTVDYLALAIIKVNEDQVQLNRFFFLLTPPPHLLPPHSSTRPCVRCVRRAGVAACSWRYIAHGF